MYHTMLRQKWQEALDAVLPIVAIVLLLCLTVAPTEPGVLLAFLLGSVLLMMGMMLFSLGADLAMEPMGERMGARITHTRSLPLVLAVCFLLGFMITISEPDLQVLAEQVQSIPQKVLILAVAAGVGVFLMIAILRMLFSIPLNTMLLVFYGVVFLLAAFTPKDFLAVAFDSGGVTTGPMTVPFIMAFGVGVCATRSDKHASVDSFGLVALCSIGPVLAVLALGLIYRPESADYIPAIMPQIDQSVTLGRLFLKEIPSYMREIAVALLPIAAFFGLFQVVSLRLNRQTIIRIVVGIAYTYVGLVLFLTGANVGFMPAGNYLGETLGLLPYRWILIPIGMVVGYFIVRAEPAAYVLMKQVEELTDGAITGEALKKSLSAGVAVSVGLAMLRVLTGLSVLWLVVPGYVTALILSFFVPKMFTAIAFDSGGVASGPMTATFLLSLAVGACGAVGGNIVTDAFGVVAMVAMTPLITIQILGLAYRRKCAKTASAPAFSAAAFDGWGDYDIIEL